MATPKLAVLISEWRVLRDNLRSHEPALPIPQESQEELDALIEEASSLSAEKVRLEGALKTVIERRERMIERGNHLQQYLAAALRGELGVSNPLLIKFGIRPRGPRGPKRQVRRRADGDPAATETSGPAPADS